MVKGTLMKKSIRDMQKSKSQFISILIMATLAISIVTGLDSIWKTIDDHAEAMYSATNLSDLWVTAKNPTETEMWGIQRINGVEKVEKRFTMNATAGLKGSPTLRVYATSSQNTLDLPSLQQGKFVSRGGAVLDETFAKAHGLKIGDSISIKINDKWLNFPIEGLALSSENVVAIKGEGSLKPDALKFGFIIIDDDLLEGAYGQKIYNQISIKLGPKADALQVEKQIDTVLGDDLIGVTARNDSLSVNNVNAKIQQFKTLGSSFPLIFFLVTALITQSTMSRLVENQRNQIGTLKALGYSKKSILWHYTSYGVYVGLLGSILGVLIGPTVFGGVLVPRLMVTFSDYRISINYIHFVFSVVLILLCTGGVSFYTCLKMQQNTPAVLLRDKPPKNGSHIFLEFIPHLWEKMKFSNKLIARNTLKNKMTLIMSVMGVMGCTGIIIAALTISNLINNISDQMFQVTYSYDQKIMLNSKADSRLIHNEALDGIVQQTEDQAMEVVCSNSIRKMEPITITTQESPLMHLKDMNGNDVILPQDGIAVTRKLAETLNLQIGDLISLKRVDDSYIQVPVKQIVYIVSGQKFFMTDKYWESIGEVFKPTSLLVKWNHKPNEEFLHSAYVDEYVNRSTQKSDLTSNTAVIYIAVGMMIIMGSILAFVVLYNSSILNFTERMRDLSTLRVLGFYQKEVRSLVLMENVLSVILGFFCGIPIGKVLISTIVHGLDENMDLISPITFSNLAIAGVITLIFAFIINKAVEKKMEDIDMLQALKSVE